MAPVFFTRRDNLLIAGARRVPSLSAGGHATPDHRALGRSVGRAPAAHRAHAGHRGDVDDAAPAPALHQPRCGLGAQQRAGDVDVHRRDEVVERKIQKREDLGDAGAVDQDVAAAELALDPFEGLGDRFGASNVRSSLQAGQ